MTNRQRLAALLKTMCENWVAAGQTRREEADAETDKVWSARQYGLADTLDDLADYLQQMINRLEDQAAEPVDWEFILDRWTLLGEEARARADRDDNRITVSYRYATGEAYQRAAEELRAALHQVGYRFGSTPTDDA